MRRAMQQSMRHHPCSRVLANLGRAALFAMISACLLCIMSGCREITAPVVPEPDLVMSGPVRVLDTQGLPLVGAWVIIRNTPADERLYWDERTDASGTVYPDLPVGRYDIEIDGQSAGEPLWEIPAVDLVANLQTIDPRPQLVEGTVAIPAGYPVESPRIRFEIRIATEGRSRSYWTSSSLGEDGAFRVVLPVDGAYLVVLNASNLHAEMAAGLMLPLPDPLQFELPLVWQELELTLDAGPLPIGDVLIRAEGRQVRVDPHVRVEGRSIGLWGPAGPVELEVGPVGAMPFLRYNTYHDFGNGEILSIELGEHFVEFEFATPSGDPVVGCAIRLTEATSNGSTTLRTLPARHTLYMRTGEYRILAERDGFIDTDLVTEITTDRVITITMDPEVSP